MDLPEGKKIYFASDFHLGIPDRASSLEREKRICRWLDMIRNDAAHLYLVGDLFDTWFEYRNVVPKGFSRFLGKLAELSDGGLSIEAFTGNHDLWMRGYFEDELNIPVHHHPVEATFNGKKFFIAHGDGLGPGDHGYKLLKKVLRSPVAQWLYRRIHPDTGIGIAGWFSRLGPKHNVEEEPFLGPDKEWLVQFCMEKLKQEHFDYFISGHRHIAIEYPLPGNSLYMNLGDWLRYDSYGVFDGAQLKLQYFNKGSKMQRTIVLIRHAKSSWADPMQSDFDRPLNDRGEHDAPLMGRRLKKHGLKPDLIICSTAKRARQTAKRIAAEVDFDRQQIEQEGRLYLCSPEVIENVIYGIDDQYKTVYIIGHNPGITDFVTEKVPGFKPGNVPTCGVIAFEVTASSWSDFGTARKSLLLYEYPKKFYDGK